jgi:CRISPR-associated protein Cmr2
MRDLPEPTDSARTEMLASLLAYQLDRQAKGDANAQAPELAHRLAQLCATQEHKCLNWLANFMGVAEFLARETRTGTTTANTHTTNESTETTA